MTRLRDQHPERFDRVWSRSRFGMVSTTCRCGTGARSVESNHCVQIARRLAWQLGQKYRHLHEKANRYSCAQSSQRTRAKPCSSTSHARNLPATCATTGRHGPPRAVVPHEGVVVDGLQPVQMVRHQPKERRRLWASGFVDAARRRRRVGHRRFESRERRAYARLGCGPSPLRCATDRFDATSAGHRPNDACCRRAVRWLAALAPFTVYAESQGGGMVRHDVRTGEAIGIQLIGAAPVRKR